MERHWFSRLFSMALMGLLFQMPITRLCSMRWRGNGFVQWKQRNRREDSGNTVNSNAGAALLPVQTKLCAILDQD
jgi:hypothetical protein